MPYSGIALGWGLMTGAKIYVKHGAIIFVGGGPLNPARMFGRRGITFGNVIFIRSKEVFREERAVLAHELTHVKQYRTYGAFFGPLYVGQTIATHGDWTRTHLEREAARVEREYNKEWEKRRSPPPLPGPFAYGDSPVPASETGGTNFIDALDLNLARGL